jgi:hypothetical protein
MLTAQANVGFPVDLPIPFDVFGVPWRALAIVLVIVTGLVIWLFRARGDDSTSIHVHRRPHRSSKRRGSG